MVKKLRIRKVDSTSLLRTCRRFLAKDPIANVLPLGDLYSPLFQVSDVFVAVESNLILGVCTVYHAFSMPSIVFGVTTPMVKRALVKRALSGIPDDFISLCQPNDVELFKGKAVILHSHFEQQMINVSVSHVECEDVEVVKVAMNELELLNDFYIKHNAEAWAPIQFKAGPYYCVKHAGEMVSSAGVHLVTPQIAQLGNIVTDEAHRNRGFATACVDMLTQDVSSRGRIASLYVRTDNAPAIHVYEKLGFAKKHDIIFLVMRKQP